jgi:agmatinase
VGAGFVRGANFAPQSLRRELLRRDSWLYRDERVVDAGDVFVVPQLLHDEMLSHEQLAQTRRALYGDESTSHEWPVSPLSVTQAAIGCIRSLAPRAAPLVLGGDHSVGWPALAAVARGRERETGILHFDAHTDLLESRLGVRYCFATWAFHANELVGRGRRMAQVGIRTSRRTREHWEHECDLRQYWMAEVKGRPVDDIADEIVSTMRGAGVRGIYVSNDIDGTDPLFALATGTPEPGGLEPATVVTLIRRLAAAFPVWGSDLVEVAPPLAGHSPREPAHTLATAAHYIEVQAEATLGSGHR